MPICNRREFLQGAALAVGLAGCSKAPRARAEERISVLRATSYGQALYGEMRRVLAEHRLQVRGKRVVLKPNLIEFEADSPIHTNPLLVHATFEALRASGAEVLIAEGPGHRRNTLDLAEAAGYFEIIPHFEDYFVDLNLDRVSKVQFAHPRSRVSSLYLAQTALSCDLLISMPKMKTHHWAGATLSMKNLFGVVPGGVYGWPKNVLHWAGINECIVDLYHDLPRHFAIVDGIVGMEGNGPIQGSAKRSGVVVVGRDLAAVDATCCQIMSIDPRRIEYLKLAAGNVGDILQSLRQIGEPIRNVQTCFDLLPVWKDIRLVSQVT